MLLVEEEAAPRARPVKVHPIEAADTERVAEFLHVHLNPRVTRDAWAHAIGASWFGRKPNAGFMLLQDDAVVGAHLAFYSERDVDGVPERVCNLGAWCVLPEHRFHALRLLRALLAQEGYSFTDLSPSGHVVPLNARLGFDFLDTSTRLAPNLPWAGRRGRATISEDPELIVRTLAGEDLRLYLDHAKAGAARHLLLMRGDESCHVIFRKDRRRGLPLFASILYASNPELLRQQARPVMRHLLLRHHVPLTLAEERIVGRWPLPSLRLRSARPKMFKSARLEQGKVDYLYSELMCVPW